MPPICDRCEDDGYTNGEEIDDFDELRTVATFSSLGSRPEPIDCEACPKCSCGRLVSCHMPKELLGRIPLGDGGYDLLPLCEEMQESA